MTIPNCLRSIDAVTSISDLMIYCGDLLADDRETVKLLQRSGTFGVVLGYIVEMATRGIDVTLLEAIRTTASWGAIEPFLRTPELPRLTPAELRTVAKHFDNLGFTEAAREPWEFAYVDEGEITDAA